MTLTKLELSRLKVVDGIAIIQNHLTGGWFIFARSIKTGEDIAVYGSLSEMKACAKYAAKHGTITQDNYGNGSIQPLVDYAKEVQNKR